MALRFRPTFRGTELWLLMFPAMIAIIGAAIIVLVPRATLDWSWSDIWVGLAFAAAVLLAVITGAVMLASDRLRTTVGAEL